MPIPNETIERVSVPDLDKLLGVVLRVLDDGFVRVIDYMGSDESVVQAARVSYGRGTKRVHEDRGLIRYLMRHHHTTPFEMAEIKFHVRVPMDCWRQWIRHRTASVNEYSTRYSVAIDVAQKTQPDAWRIQSRVGRQGSEGLIDPVAGRELSEEEGHLQKYSRSVYERRIELGVAREQARKDLPLSTYTEAYWKIDLHNLLHFLELRMNMQAQFEIRSYANCIGEEIVKRWCPLVWEAFRDYRLNGVSLSDVEIRIVDAVANGRGEEATALASRYGLLEKGTEGLKKNRERAEVEEKLARFGLKVPWHSD